jgi:hypothetical protein
VKQKRKKNLLYVVEKKNFDTKFDHGLAVQNIIFSAGIPFSNQESTNSATKIVSVPSSKSRQKSGA